MRTNDLNIVCKRSGIVGTVNLPTIPGKQGAALEYRHPLSFLDAALDIISQPRGYLLELNSNALAGIYLTLLRSTGTLHTKLHAATLNQLFSYAGKGILIRGAKTLARYVVTLRAVNKAYPLPQVNPEALMLHLVDVAEANKSKEVSSWIAEVTSTLAIEATDTGSVEAFAKHLQEEGKAKEAELLTPVMLERLQNKEARQAALEAKIEAIQAAKARAKERKTLDKALTVEELMPQEALGGLSLIEHQIQQRKLSHEGLRTKLLDGFSRMVRATCKHLPTKQRQTIDAIGAALPTYDNAYIATIISKLEASTMDYAVIPHLLHCVTLCDQRSVSLEDELLGWDQGDVAPAAKPVVKPAAKPAEGGAAKLSLAERLAQRAAERKGGME